MTGTSQSGSWLTTNERSIHPWFGSRATASGVVIDYPGQLSSPKARTVFMVDGSVNGTERAWPSDLY